MKKIMMLIFVALVVMGNDGCDSADREQREATEKTLAEAHRQIGMPDITRFTERKLARDILELRDQENLSTWTYIIDLHGKLHLLGRSIGYGLPYSVQFTNPERMIGQGGTIPQADPNGLFMPDGLSATWILLIDPKTKKARPVYVEPQIVVSPFPLEVK